jgi:hypothetical protein
VLAIKKATPAVWPNHAQIPFNGPAIGDIDMEIGVPKSEIQALAPPIQFSPEIIRLVRDDLRNKASVLVEARQLANFPRGRYPIEYMHRPRGIVLASDESMVVTDVLWADAVMAAQDQQIDRALISATALLNTARSIGDEPTLTSQCHRLAIQRQALFTVERVLAQGQASANRLEALQLLLQQEMAEPLMLMAFRAERAGTYQHMSAILSGEWRFTLRFFHGRVANKLPDSWNRYIEMVIVRRSYPAYFRLLTALVEAAKLPPHDQPKQIERLIEQSRQLPIEFQSWFASVARWVDGFRRNQAWLRCAIAALAAERYRIAYGHWPDSLEVLVPGFLLEVPIDPFDCGLLRFRRLSDSVVIYSIDPDGIDNEGLLNRDNLQAMGFGAGFQLWDVSQRRQPWRPPPKAKSETEDGDDETP